MRCKKAIMYQNIWAASRKADPDFSTIGKPNHKSDWAGIIAYNICEAVLLKLAFCYLTMKTIWWLRGNKMKLTIIARSRNNFGVFVNSEKMYTTKQSILDKRISPACC